MNINIKSTSIDLTPAIESYVADKLDYLKKYVSRDEDSAFLDVEIGKTTQHHKLGDHFRAEINLLWKGKMFRSETNESDLYAAIDVAKDNLLEQLSSESKKRTTLIRRGGRVIKGLLKGIGRKFKR